MVGTLALQPALASAQIVVPSTSLDPSPRAAGMGGVSTAVFWSNDPNEWANPSLLGYGDGLTYRWSRIEPGSRGDVFRSHRFNYGWGGIGLAAAKLGLDYSAIDLTNPSGTQVGTFVPSERIDAIGGGVSISRVIRTVAALRGADAPGIARRADIAFGFVRKPVEVQLAPPGFWGEASTRANDVGVLVRVSPMVDGDGGGAFLDLAYGFAALNHNDAGVIFAGTDMLNYVERQYRNGFAARFGVSPSPEATRGLERRFGRLIGQGMFPLVSLALAADFSHFQTGPSATNPHDANGIGLEVALVNVLALRVGHVTDRLQDVDGYSWGLGIGLPLGTVANARYEFARVPKPANLERASPHGLTLSINPLAIARR